MFYSLNLVIKGEMTQSELNSKILKKRGCNIQIIACLFLMYSFIFESERILMKEIREFQSVHFFNQLASRLGIQTECKGPDDSLNP